MWLIKDRIDNEQFIKVCKNSKSMAEAAAILELHFNSFKKRAIELGCYQPNQSGRGISKKAKSIPLNEILEGLHPYYQTYKLKKRLLKEGIKENKCEVCDITEWNDEIINMELDHIDGNRRNHKEDNLRMICPNCHSQTETYRSKNRK